MRKLSLGRQRGSTQRKILPLLVTIAVVALGIALGLWQVSRAHEKEAMGAKLAARAHEAPLTVAPVAQNSIEVDALEFRHLRVKGEFVAQWPLYLENRPYQNKVGLYVLMPFKLSAQSAPSASAPQYLLVARGWLERNRQDRSKLPQLATPSGEIEIEGIIRRQPTRVMQLGDMPALAPAAIVQNVDVAQMAAATKLALMPYFVEQIDSPASSSASAPVVGAISDHLIRDWPAATLGVDRHWGYAVTWFGLTAMAILFYVFTGFRRARRSE